MSNNETGKAHSDLVQLRLLLLSGKSIESFFNPNDTISTVKAYAYENWPEEWKGEKPLSVSCIRVIHNGRFQPDDATLISADAKTGVLTVMHLHVASYEPPSEKNKDNTDKIMPKKIINGAKCCTLM